MKFNCRGGSTGGQGGQLPPLSFYLYYINDMKGGVSYIAGQSVYSLIILHLKFGRRR